MKHKEGLRNYGENGLEFWYARELISLPEYSKWKIFHQVIKKAMIACKASNYIVLEQFPDFRKPIKGGNGNIQCVIDYHLNRYACYLIVQNANSKMKSVALERTYFVIQTKN